MRNDRVLIPVLHVARDAKCFSSCVNSYFHRQLSDKVSKGAKIRNRYNQVPHLTKMQTFGLYEYKLEESGCGFNQKWGLAETGS